MNNYRNIVAVRNPNVQNTFQQPHRQKFAFQRPIIKYILQNPASGKAWKKLIQTCKYFFPKYPVYPIGRVTGQYGKWDGDRENLDQIEELPPLWLYGDFRYFYAKKDISKLITNVFRCNLRSLHIDNQILSWNDYQFLTSSASFESIFIYNCSIKYSDGTIVTMDKLLENIHSLKDFGM
uniref:Uncharacterized protein n=1 Tax=Panagrolaimus superbus TaxID=310955 RepID=A0A914XS37_9BILA